MQELKDRFKSKYPSKYFLDGNNLVELSHYLNELDLLGSNESIVACSSPGAGNMNYVVRVKTNQKSLIVKQSRPWVEKYPMIDAPEERVNIEAAFYHAIADSQTLREQSPRIYAHDPDNFILIMQDLGDVSDFSFLYALEKEIDEKSVIFLADYLKALHSLNVMDFPLNTGMRQLNHEHIFNFPFNSDNGFELEAVQSGLSSIAINEKTDPDLVNIITEMGQIYLSPGETLLHGDFYPGSWMQSNGNYVLDPEFAFKGQKEFDLGVLIAHMKMASQADKKVDSFLGHYGAEISFDKAHAMRFAGVEILRRLLGVAQLPLQLSVAQKRELVSLAKGWLTA